MRLLLDEMYPALIARDLRARGRDAVSVHEAPGSGAPDPVVLAFAIAEGRAVVTENVRDFRPLAQQQIESSRHHCGVVFTTEKRWPRADLAASSRPWRSLPRRRRSNRSTVRYGSDRWPTSGGPRRLPRAGVDGAARATEAHSVGSTPGGRRACQSVVAS